MRGDSVQGSEPVSHSQLGEDEARLGGIFLELLSKQSDIAPQRLGIRARIARPARAGAVRLSACA